MSMNQLEESTSNFVTLKQAARYFNLKEDHIRSLVFYRKIKFYKIGALLRFKLSELETQFKEEEGVSNDFKN